jgi:hypothetical protein
MHGRKVEERAKEGDKDRDIRDNMDSLVPLPCEWPM